MKIEPLGIKTTDIDATAIRILVVEDIALNQLLMKALLDHYGFQRDFAENGRIAVEKLEKNSYDIILMDLQMPVMNGFETTEYIRKKMNLDIPIIAISADVTTTDLSQCQAVGMDDYMAKPIDEQLLYTKIANFVQKPGLNPSKTYKNMEEQDSEKTPGGKSINLDYLNRLTKSEPTLMTEMISVYLTQTPPLIQAMKAGLIIEDWPMVWSSAHKMLPSFSIMGITKEAEEIAKEIQVYTAKESRETEKIRPLVEKLETICLNANKELELELTKIKKESHE